MDIITSSTICHTGLGCHKKYFSLSYAIVFTRFKSKHSTQTNITDVMWVSSMHNTQFGAVWIYKFKWIFNFDLRLIINICIYVQILNADKYILKNILYIIFTKQNENSQLHLYPDVTSYVAPRQLTFVETTKIESFSHKRVVKIGSSVPGNLFLPRYRCIFSLTEKFTKKMESDVKL
jgi:hypothetical protein